MADALCRERRRADRLQRELSALAAVSTVILVRKAAWKRPRSTVITGLAMAPEYVRQGYKVDWNATEEANTRPPTERGLETHAPPVPAPDPG